MGILEPSFRRRNFFFERLSRGRKKKKRKKKERQKDRRCSCIVSKRENTNHNTVTLYQPYVHMTVCNSNLFFLFFYILLLTKVDGRYTYIHTSTTGTCACLSLRKNLTNSRNFSRPSIERENIYRDTEEEKRKKRKEEVFSVEEYRSSDLRKDWGSRLNA